MSRYLLTVVRTQNPFHRYLSLASLAYPTLVLLRELAEKRFWLRMVLLLHIHVV